MTKIAVANRGEIAKRILSACKELNLKSALLFAMGDTQQSAYRLADERISIGPADPRKSYLNIEANIQGAKAVGATHLHPGYGFLSENPAFAKACKDHGLVFIGPPSKSLEQFGNKIQAKKLAQKAGISVLKSFPLKSSLSKKDFPVMIKASSGGGGRGLRIAHNPKELEELLPLVRQEALQSFNSEEIFLEQYLSSAKHIELQIFISASGEVFILGDRDCSGQRRHQKILEEAPSLLPKKLKDKMKQATQEFCSLLEYQGAGTLEFLVQGDQFYFLEMNTRLQVEHTVTEMIYGVDLVKAQILTALGQPAFFKDKELLAQGHSIQCRICAEDPYKSFLPSVGQLLACHWPLGKNIRVDTGYQKGDTISTFYDSLMAKVIVWEDSRVRAIEKMKQALNQTVIFGVLSNIPFLQFLLSHPLFIDNQLGINSLEELHLKEFKASKQPLPVEFLQELFKELQSSAKKTSAKDLSFNPWSDFLKSKED